ncbi:cellulose binding domain-containing protein [Micromonospora sp. NPDC051296]|uniref:cellulose binding domain-containing protein n=1 Tax=Micromonospora sp. NPDC051296 TaxID=3155046 RepID=UPI003432D45A
MSVRPGGAETGEEAGGRTARRVIASAPWVVVLLGTALLVVMLVVAVLSFRGPERPTQSALAPPMSLPIPAAADTLAPEDSPSGPNSPSQPSGVSPTPSGSSAQPAIPSRTASAAAPSSAGVAPTSSAPEEPLSATDTGEVAVSYKVLNEDETSFRARLSVSNGGGESRDWRVELRFTGDVTGISASSGPGVSVTIKDTGWYLLSGTRPLDAGSSQTVHLRFSRTGGGVYPALCTVNGSACAVD